MKLFEEDWVREVAHRVANDPTFQKRAKGFNVRYQYVVKASPQAGVTQDYMFGFKFPEATEMWMGQREKTEFVMTVSYQVFHDILAGKSNAIIALTTRRAFISGSLPTLLRYTSAINRIVEIFQAIPADGEGSFGPIGKPGPAMAGAAP